MTFALAIMLSAGTGLALGKSPEGAWESATGESRYEVTMCGDGTQLCAKLTWLRDDARTADNLQYLNKFVLHGAKASGPDTWQGTVDVNGEQATGSITVVSDNKLKLTGCRLILCQTVEFNRI